MRSWSAIKPRHEEWPGRELFKPTNKKLAQQKGELAANVQRSAHARRRQSPSVLSPLSRQSPRCRQRARPNSLPANNFRLMSPKIAHATQVAQRQKAQRPVATPTPPVATNDAPTRGPHKTYDVCRQKRERRHIARDRRQDDRNHPRSPLSLSQRRSQPALQSARRRSQRFPRFCVEAIDEVLVEDGVHPRVAGDGASLKND